MDKLPSWAVEGSFVVLRNGFTVLKIAEVSEIGCGNYAVTALYYPTNNLNEPQENKQQRRLLQNFLPLSEWKQLNPTQELINHWEKHPSWHNQLENKETTMKQLYTWNDGFEARFGYKIGTTSEGLWVMEMKGGEGKVFSTDPKGIEKVLPYSVEIYYDDDSDLSYHFWVKKEEGLEVGDVIFNKGVFMTVKAVDTKSDKANKWLTGFRLQGKRLKAPE